MKTRNKQHYFPSQWMRHDGLPPDGLDVVITSVDDEVLGRDEVLKPVLNFRESYKRLPLNGSQFDSIAELTGTDDVDQWANVRVKLCRHIMTIKNRKAGTQEDVKTIQILPASPLVASDQPEKPQPSHPPTLKRKSTLPSDRKGVPLGRTVDEDGESIPF
jgi:hypothetical protein